MYSTGRGQKKIAITDIRKEFLGKNPAPDLARFTALKFTQRLWIYVLDV